MLFTLHPLGKGNAEHYVQKVEACLLRFRRLAATGIYSGPMAAWVGNAWGLGHRGAADLQGLTGEFKAIVPRWKGTQRTSHMLVKAAKRNLAHAVAE